MFLKAQQKILSEDNTQEMKIIMVEMEEATLEDSKETRNNVYFSAVRRAVAILSEGNKILMGWQFEVVECLVNKDEEYNLQMKSSEVQVENDNIYLIK